VTTTAPTPATTPRLTGWSRSPQALRRLAVASVVSNVAIVVTGGAVRLSGSGLGCPTWPQCSDDSLVPSNHVSIHKIIEFSNRSLTFVLGIVLLATFIAAWRQRSQVRVALLSLLGVPAQAVLGGVVVLTHLNPWFVAAHFLLSAGLIGVTMVLWWRLSGKESVAVPPVGVLLARALVAITAAVLAIGTVVTGTGPHAGDLDEDGRLHRIHLSPAGVSQLHADTVMVLIGATVGMLALVYAVQGLAVLRRAVAVLLGVELAQGIIGYTQYFLHVPAVLVGFHMFGACLVWLAALRVLLMVRAEGVAVRPRPAA
jgi:cytochrome c oxidase assembly protein subunit 15